MSFDFGDPLAWIAAQARQLLLNLGLSPELTDVILNALGAAVLAGLVLAFSGIFLTWLDRKLSGRIQDRLGPNRVGPFGLLQPVADAIKLITKEDTTPAGADKFLFNLAPLLAAMSVIGLWAVVPFAPRLIGTDLNVGILYLISIGAIGTLAIMLAGFASNNKYALLGAFRTVSQMVSYTVPLVLAMLVPTMLAGSMGMVAIVEAQASIPFIVLAPIAALVFFVSSLAEVGRTPFDIFEAESEIVSGYNIEYSGMKFGIFFVAEFLHAFTIAALTTTLFLGGWQGPGVDSAPILGIVYFLIKTSIVYFVLTLTRFTIPRLRIDQINAFNWKFVTPIALLIVIVGAIAEKVAQQYQLSRLTLHLGGNFIVLVLIAVVIGSYSRRARLRFERYQADRAPITREAGGSS
jgi:NADH-quinone oxidoreductase subunit H